MIYDRPICFACIHFDIEDGTCPAFPVDGIPDEIFYGLNDHKKEIPGQVPGILFDEVKQKMGLKQPLD
jgi:hypothetical protein